MKKRPLALRWFFLLIAISPLLLLFDCRFKRNGRDCLQEYDQLAVEEFHTLREAKAAMRDYLSVFEDQEQCLECRDKVEQMEAEFVEMDNLFSNIDKYMPKERYCAFISMVNSNKNTFSGSSFETVRVTWNYLVESKKDTIMRERLDLIDENDFKLCLMKQAKELALTWFGSRQWEVIEDKCKIVNDQLEDVYVVDGKLAKRASCIVHVEMQGNVVTDDGLVNKIFPRVVEKTRRRGSVDIWVEGTLSISESDCKVIFASGHGDIAKGQDGEDLIFGDLIRAEKYREIPRDVSVNFIN